MVAGAQWSCSGQTVADDALETELDAWEFGEIIGEEDCQAIPLVGWQRHFHSVQVFLSLHERETYPGIGSLHKLSEDFEVDTCDVTFRGVDATIVHLQVVDLVGYQVAQVLVINLGCHFEWSVEGSERVVTSQNHVDASLRLDVTVQCYDRISVVVNSLYAIFLVEGRLVVQTTCKPEGKVAVSFRNIANAETWRYERLLVEVPVAVAHSHVEGKDSGSGVGAVGVLDESREAIGAQVIVGRHVVYHIHLVGDVWQRVTCRVAPLPFSRTLEEDVVAQLDSVTDIVLVESYVTL